MTALSFAVEFDRKVVGVAVRAPGGFAFFPSDPTFHALEGKVFTRVRAMMRRLAEVARRPKQRAREFFRARRLA